MRQKVKVNQLDHCDPVWFDGVKTEPGFEQLVCGLDLPLNWRQASVSENSKKSDRFLPYRLGPGQTAPTKVGDLCQFLVGGVWVELGWLTPAWFVETTKTGRFHQARQGRASAKRRDGAVGWRASVDPATLAAATEKQSKTVRARLATGQRWGALLPENQNCSLGGTRGGPKTATDKNKELRNLTKVVARGGVKFVCEPGVLGAHVKQKLLELAPDCAPLQTKDVHRLWSGGKAKGWELVAVF